MKVILLHDVKNLGKTNDVLKVKDGYAKNYLIKNKLAVVYTNVASQKLNIDLHLLDEAEQKRRKQATLTKNELESLKIKLTLKTNKDQVFGSISNKAIMEAVNESKKIVTKHMFHEAHKLGLGFSNVKIDIYKDIFATLKIEVVGV